jgi:hypothetical protein
MVRARLLAKALNRRLGELRIIIGDLRGDATDYSKETPTGYALAGSVADIVDRVQQIQRGQVGVSEPIEPAPPVAVPTSVGVVPTT